MVRICPVELGREPASTLARLVICLTPVSLQIWHLDR